MADPVQRSFRVPGGWFLVICVILAAQAAGSRRLDVVERDLPLPGLHSLPPRIGNWQSGEERELSASEAATLKPDEYILRDYVDENGKSSINLFVAYFKSLQNAYGPHSPRICLPGSGWLVKSSKIGILPLRDRPEGIPVNEYVMEKGGDSIFVLYWYQNNRHTWAEEYWAKLRLLPDLLRYKRSDVSLVRLVTPLGDATPEQNLARCLNFTNQAFPLIAERLGSVD
ncbi:MAG: exosortase C-terminal domain/associated protein EpsI [Bryobacteraceae bacterium]